MNVFDAALRTLEADPNMAEEADYLRGRVGPAVRVRVLRSNPDALAITFDVSLIRPTDVLTVRREALAPNVPEPGDAFVLADGTVLIVQTARLDETGSAWTIQARRQAHHDP